MNFWNEDKIAWAGLPEKAKRWIESGPLERLNDKDAWESWAGELEDNGVYRSVYDWKENPETIPYRALPRDIQDKLDALSLGDLEYWSVWEQGWRNVCLKPSYAYNDAYRIKKEYDWLGNPEKRLLRGNESMRQTYEDAWRQGNLEFWFRGVWLEDRFNREDPELDNGFAYRVKPVDTSNPDWIVWGKLDERVKEAIRKGKKVQGLSREGKWIDWCHTFYDGVAFRTAP